MMKHFVFFFISGLFILQSAKGQKTNVVKQPLPLSISLMDESISLPNAWFLRYSVNPAIMLGTEFLLRRKNNHDWHLSGQLGMYYHKTSQFGVFINPALGFRLSLGRWNIFPRLGLGYAHTFHPSPIFKIEDGVFVEATDYGKPSLLTSASIGIGYKILPREYSPELFVSCQFQAHFPLSIYTGIHQFVGIGIPFSPFLFLENPSHEKHLRSNSLHLLNSVRKRRTYS